MVVWSKKKARLKRAWEYTDKAVKSISFLFQVEKRMD